MSRLSISKAWDETTRILAHDSKLISSVALALIVLPQTIAGAIAPPPALSGVEPPNWTGMVMLLVAALGIIGEIAIMRLALGRISVGDSITHGARRALAAIGALLLIVLALCIVIIPIMFAVAGTAGIESMSTGQPTAAAGWAVLLVLVIFILVGPKIQLIIPAAAGEAGGPIHLLKRSWQLSDGVYWQLLGFLTLLVLIAVIVVLFIGQIMVGLLVRASFGTVHPLSIGALVAALLSAAFAAAFTSVASVLLARVYGQLAGGTVSVPNSGT